MKVFEIVGTGGDNAHSFNISTTSALTAAAGGISTPEQARKMANISDGVIVGSAIIRLLEKYGSNAPEHIGEYVRSMKDAITY